MAKCKSCSNLPSAIEERRVSLEYQSKQSLLDPSPPMVRELITSLHG